MVKQGCLSMGCLLFLAVYAISCSSTHSPWKPTNPSQGTSEATTDPKLFGQTDEAENVASPNTHLANQVEQYVATFPEPPNDLPVIEKDKPDSQQRPSSSHPILQSPESASSMSSVSLDSVAAQRQPALPRTDKALPRLEGVTVRAVSEVPEAQVLPQNKVIANHPGQVDLSTFQSTIPSEIEKLEQVVESQPNDIHLQLRLRYLYLAEGRKQQALEPTSGMDPQRAELLTKLLKAGILTEQVLHQPELVSHEVSQAVDEFSNWVKSRAALEVSYVNFCKSIHSFGKFETVPEGYFVAGASGKAFVYCEIKNFGTQPGSSGQYVARLSHRLELLTPEGDSIWKDDQEMTIEDECRHRRTDFFFYRLWQLPEGVNAGEYVLKVTVEDLVRSQVSEARHVFTVAPAGVAASKN